MKLISGTFASSLILDKAHHHLRDDAAVPGMILGPFHTHDPDPWLILFCFPHELRRQQRLRRLLRVVQNVDVDAELAVEGLFPVSVPYSTCRFR